MFCVFFISLAPEAPIHLRNDSRTTDDISLAWSRPNNTHGVLKSFKVSDEFVKNFYTV